MRLLFYLGFPENFQKMPYVREKIGKIKIYTLDIDLVRFPFFFLTIVSFEKKEETEIKLLY